MFFKRSKSKTVDPVQESPIDDHESPIASEESPIEIKEPEECSTVARESSTASGKSPIAPKDSPEVAMSTITKPGFFRRITQGLSRTSNRLTNGIGALVLGKKTIDDDLLEELENQLLIADFGIEATTRIIEHLTDRLKRRQLNDGDALYKALQDYLSAMLKAVEQPLAVESSKAPYVILVVGVNGVGKTTTIGKLANRLRQEKKSVVLAAGDTFRAAATEQLQAWGERSRVPVVSQHLGADSASVIFDAVESARARGIDVVIADTAGRLQNKTHLMQELEKVKRVVSKIDVSAPHEILLVLDAGTGQNAISQTQQFSDLTGVTGIALTKLDGTAKGGIIFALTEQFKLPIRFVGVGESIDDLQPFVADAFVEALFNR